MTAKQGDDFMDLVLASSGVKMFAAAAAVIRSDDAAGACGCLGFFGFLGFIVIGFIALNIAILVWVAKDAKNRGMDNAVVWMLLVMLTGIIGLIIYLLVRPQGNLIVCPNCKNKRLQVSAKCPHCGNI
jgi:ammonia channel protein AmtB